ncbi:family 20 glycosylhydrolase [Capnocytophaga sputigena]|jgi:glycoside hydrolase family 20, candidate beta-N-acetylhexosaminidase|uniref:beta-N-acetylhexosaminidase n=1 Tax=Capnocytophaga sputigena TaxID=1019 RepID=UPI0028897269|nr:family 20 glycosylhydrolase [Capnocytophaga sputigena]
MKIKLTSALLLLMTMISCKSTTTNGEGSTANYEIVPTPEMITNPQTEADKPFVLTADTKLIYPEGDAALQQYAGFLQEYIKKQTGIEVKVAPNQNDEANTISLSQNYSNDNKEAYQVTITANNITINGASKAGTFYGVQFLRKSIPVQKVSKVTFPAKIITDKPYFAYRGAHLDSARHFFSADSVRIYIDMLALHNINKFHWHLTDDQGWRFESKKYPELTVVGSTRSQTMLGKEWDKFDGKPHSGFYTQQEMKELVKYAAERNITIIPEIDLPGHMVAVLATYPKLGCTGGPYKVRETWGVAEDVLCAGNDETYDFIKNILEEVTEIFPSEYIHIGGDECPKNSWKKCPKCQAKIKALGIKGDAKHTAEEYLQSHIITFAEEVLAKKGRKMIGWDEILEGGLAPNATVMSWRGIGGAIEAAKSNHDAIMTPMSFCYFDFYQTDKTDKEPLAIGNYLPVERVYSFNPYPEALNKEQQKHILGVQANIWTEYIQTFKHVEYMALPRMAALAEVQWVDPSKPKDYQAFLQRLMRLLPIYEVEGYTYAKHIFDLRAEVKPGVDEINVTFSCLQDTPIYYTTDGSEPTKNSNVYKEPLKLTQNTNLKAKVFGKEGESEFNQEFFFNKATVRPIEFLSKPTQNYAYNGAITLVDGRKGGTNSRSSEWLGFSEAPCEALITLKDNTLVKEVSFNAFIETGDWIYPPTNFEVWGSKDGKNYELIGKASYDMPKEHFKEIKTYSLSFPEKEVTYLKVKINEVNKIPAFHEGAAGKPGFLFIDEIQVN